MGVKNRRKRRWRRRRLKRKKRGRREEEGRGGGIDMVSVHLESTGAESFPRRQSLLMAQPPLGGVSHDEEFP